MRAFAHSTKDAWLVGLASIHLALLFGVAWHWRELSVVAMAAAGIASVALICTNYQCIGHNFIHHPFFRSEVLNKGFSALNSISLGFPQTLYRVHHLLHHRYNNSPGDDSSIYLHSRIPGRAEALWRYALLGPFRADFDGLYRKVNRIRRPWVWLEAGLVLSCFGGLAYHSPQFFFAFLLPSWFLGQAAALAENYLEHFRADPRRPLADSVSCYNRLYNVLWFNNGYHQEHHARPDVHWTRIPSVREKMPPSAERVVVPGAHLFNLFGWRYR